MFFCLWRVALYFKGMPNSWDFYSCLYYSSMVLRPLLLLIYINDLTDVIQCICKIFADGMFLFLKCQDFKKCERECEYFFIIKKWTFQWKMDFNPNPPKQAIEVCFSRKFVSNYSKPISFTQFEVKTSKSLKH